MRFVATLRAACLLALSVALTSALADPKKDIDELMRRDGLQKISVKGIGLAYALPGATLAAYKRVMLDPIDVEFDKSWDPVKTGSRLKLGTEEREKIRTDVARIVNEQFVKELQAKSSYQIASDAGPDVLRVKAYIVNLYLNAPDADGGGRSRTFVASAGRMTLLAELYDAGSGQLLARVADQREASSSGRMQLAGSMVNEDEARTIAADWARILRKSLDNAHGIGK